MTDMIAIDGIESETISIPIIGTGSLIVHRFSEKSKATMLGAQQGRKAPKQSRDPEADYQAAFHRLKDGTPGFPALGFKACTVSAGRFFNNVTMTELRQLMFFHGEPGTDGIKLVRIEGEPHMREDVVRIARGSTDLRYRPEFPEWRTDLQVTYVKSGITQNSLLSLIDAGGLGVGVGEWRPEKRGDFGTFQVDFTRDIEVLKAETRVVTDEPKG